MVLGAIIVNYNGYTDPIVEGIYYTVIGGMIGWLIPIKYNLFYYLFKKIRLVKSDAVNHDKLGIQTTNECITATMLNTGNIFGANYNNFGNTKLCLGNRGVPQVVYYVNLNTWQRFWLRFMGFKVEKLK